MHFGVLNWAWDIRLHKFVKIGEIHPPISGTTPPNIRANRLVWLWHTMTITYYNYIYIYVSCRCSPQIRPLIVSLTIPTIRGNWFSSSLAMGNPIFAKSNMSSVNRGFPRYQIHIYMFIHMYYNVNIRVSGFPKHLLHAWHFGPSKPRLRLGTARSLACRTHAPKYQNIRFYF